MTTSRSQRAARLQSVIAEVPPGSQSRARSERARGRVGPLDARSGGPDRVRGLLKTDEGQYTPTTGGASKNGARGSRCHKRTPAGHACLYSWRMRGRVEIVLLRHENDHQGTQPRAGTMHHPLPPGTELAGSSGGDHRNPAMVGAASVTFLLAGPGPLAAADAYSRVGNRTRRTRNAWSA